MLDILCKFISQCHNSPASRGDRSDASSPHPTVGQSSSLHEWGQRAATVVEQARMQVAGLLNASDSESIIFTLWWIDNLAIMGTPVLQYTSAFDYFKCGASAVAEPARLLKQWGWDVTHLPVDAKGWLIPDLQAALRPNTLVSVIYGQSEVGTLQPLRHWETLPVPTAFCFTQMQSRLLVACP